MAGRVNKVILMGNLGRDPEVRNTHSGSKIVNLAIATSETWNDRNRGERRDRTEWHRVSIVNKRIGEVAERYLRKGRKVYIEDELRTRKWTDKQDVKASIAKAGVAIPDLHVLHDGRLLCVELKTKSGRLTEAQAALRERIHQCGGAVSVCRSLENVVPFLTENGVKMKGSVI